MPSVEPDLIGGGIYTVPEAGRLTGVHPTAIRRWLRGYAYHSSNEVRVSVPVWQKQLPAINERLALGFLDLIEVRFVNAFRQQGVSWNAIRRAAERAKKLFDHDHPFCSQSFTTDGRTIFAEVLHETGEKAFLDVVNNQFAFKKVLSPYLVGLDFDEQNRIARRWWPMGHNRRVVLDPLRQFGQPIVATEGVPTSVLSRAFRVERSMTAVASWYEVSTKSVRDAVAFERQIAA